MIFCRIDNIVYPLFLDPNHLVCIDSSRNCKMKQRYNTNSCFEKINDEKELDKEEINIKDCINLLLEGCEDDNLSREDIIEILKDIVN